ncbi:MAG: ATP-grasp domain-containing protein, partial [Bdellovibrionales bacterium]|nr:ATP-grasp domain-containing protein [Bdellovibrionales bacterium]
FQEFSHRKSIKKLKLKSFPLIVKCLNEEASLGIATASIANTAEKVMERVKFIHQQYNTEAIVEEFIPGIELYVGVLGNLRLQTLPVWQLFFDDVDSPDKEIYSERAKFNKNYRQRKGIRTGPAEISEELEKRVVDIAKKTYRALDLNGYARIDLRVTEDQRIYVLEANPNPDISKSDEFAMSAKKDKINYKELLTKILNLSR